MLNLFWAHQGPLGCLRVFALNINVASGEGIGNKEFKHLVHKHLKRAEGQIPLGPDVDKSV